MLLEQPLSANAATDATLLAHSAVQVEVQGQVLTCVQLVACFHDGAVALQGGSGSAIALQGHSAIVEAGYKLNAGKNLTLDFNLNGAMGKQRGIGGGIGAQWMF